MRRTRQVRQYRNVRSLLNTKPRGQAYDTVRHGTSMVGIAKPAPWGCSNWWDSPRPKCVRWTPDRVCLDLILRQRNPDGLLVIDSDISQLLRQALSTRWPRTLADTPLTRHCLAPRQHRSVPLSEIIKAYELVVKTCQ